MTVKQIIRKECVSKTKESGIWNQKFEKKNEKKELSVSTTTTMTTINTTMMEKTKQI